MKYRKGVDNMMKHILRRIVTAVMSAALILTAPALIPGGSGMMKAEAATYGSYQVSVNSGYLALRRAMAYDQSNEIGKLWNGDVVELIEATSSTYWYVYAPSLGLYGYVNNSYLSYIGSQTYYDYNVMTVSVSDSYLALRTAKSFDYSNEIGKLWSGDQVEVLDASDSSYYYVYARSLGMYGYVNADYLYGGSGSYNYSYATMTVSVAKGYLALRTAMAYDSSNEIGKLYTGDTVQVIDSSNPDYYYVYAPSLGKYGYVNADYIFGSVVYQNYSYWTVGVNSGYLALRNAKAYDTSNEIGKLWNGQVVQPIDTSDASYWYVYAPSLGMYGFVNSEFLY